MAIEVVFNPELESIEIEASNLESLLIKLSEPCQINLLPCENLNKLELYSATVTDKWLHGVLSKHPLIESLNLNRCDMLKRIKISSDRMKSLTFFRCSELVEINVVTPNLHRLEYCGYVISFSSNISTLSEVKLEFARPIALNAQKIEFLTKLNHPKLLTWRVGSTQNVITSKEFRKIQPSPLYNVKQLKLLAVFIPTRDEINKLVDALLWISPLLETLSIEWGHAIISFKVLYLFIS
ncbi:hypothetical protein SLA2020_354370 [Shorea laevis]